ESCAPHALVRGRIQVSPGTRNALRGERRGVATASAIAPHVEPTVYGPDPIEVEGRHGARYWVYHPINFCGQADVDERLAGYPVAVWVPPGRPAHETPVVIGLHGLAAPYLQNGFLLPTLLDRGIACVLFEAPAAGERSLVRAYD